MNKSLFFFTFLLIHTTFIFSQDIPLHLATDDAHAPFLHGVASGDPLQDRVMIWTRVEPDDSTIGTIDVAWEMSEDSSFSKIVNSGIYPTGETIDWTVKIDVDGLRAGATYYYRFESQGAYSRIGRTRTLAAEGVEHLRFCTFSCSSLYSGYFNAYRRISERDDLDFVVHVGDFIYDFIDSDEQVRIPENPVEYPETLEEWRALYKLYLTDIDLRAARQQHPWIMIWDNHDVGEKNENAVESIQAFWEYLPIRQPDPAYPARIYRDFNVGGLVDLTMIDILLHRDKDTLETGGINLLGTVQHEWFEETLLQSEARWRVIGQQKIVSGWTALRALRDKSSWDGFPEYRKHFYEFLRDNQIENNLILTGDAHLGLAMDFIGTQAEADFYVPETGEGSVAVEVLSYSISRGNFDESGVPITAADAFNEIHLNENPNHYFADLFRHGYGLIDVRMDSITAEFWASDILAPTDEEEFIAGVVTYYGENHWQRTLRNTPTPAKVQINTGVEESVLPAFPIEIYPNPSSDIINIRNRSTIAGEWYKLRIYNTLGQLIYQSGMYGDLSLSLTDWASGVYLIELENTSGHKISAKMVKE